MNFCLHATLAGRQWELMPGQDIAEILENSQQAVSRLEGYDANPTLKTLERDANAVGAVFEIMVRAEGVPDDDA